MEIKLIGIFEEVEAITRELRRLFVVTAERDRSARSGDIRRYLTLTPAPTPNPSPRGRGEKEEL